MKTVGIIAEYNPFHTGHEYQINYVRQALGADYIVVAMSGDFVQRGTPALLPKHQRAKMALCCGADLVLELPVSVSTASAELFARGGVQLLDGLGVVDELCFGSECGDGRCLMELAKILVREPKEYQRRLRDYLKKGMSFPSARCEALEEYAALESEESGLQSFGGDIRDILSSPNNILGIEYCKALLREKSSMKPAVLLRKGSDYHADTLKQGQFPSASAIRRAVLSPSDSQAPQDFSGWIPDACLELFLASVKKGEYLAEEDFDPIYRYCLLRENPESLCRYLDMSEELARRILARRGQYKTFSQFAGLLKTKELTLTRIQRALLHMLLGICQAPNRVPFARVLGFRRASAPLLAEIKKRGTLPLITKLPDAPDILAADALELLEENTFSSNLYQSLLAAKTRQEFRHEYEKAVVII